MAKAQLSLFKPKKSTKVKVKKHSNKKRSSKKHYTKLKRPSHPVSTGLFSLRAKAKTDKTFGKLCLICKAKLRYKSGRPPVICPSKESCFRAYRNFYRRDYDKSVAA
jgi:hypothetical protein